MGPSGPPLSSLTAVRCTQPKGRSEEGRVNLAVTLRNLFSKSQRIAGGEAGGLRIVTRGGDPDFARGAYEPPVQQPLASNLNAGDVCLRHRLRRAAWGAAGRVYAFEPVPQSVAAIEQSARPNRFDTICVFAEAVGPECAPPTGDL